MALTPGSRIGPYEITTQIGVGGMGEVYRATDTKLNRDVALKVLPEAFIADADRLARFKREAQVLAALNHPGIAAIYGFEDASTTHALVMELVEGPTLADRIAQGPIAVAEALPIAKQIAEALEAAHEQGIVHRDLKPANIKVRDDGTVKVLDFGLAKAVEPASGMSSSASMSPTITTPAMTQAGMILGTAAYMSPEQARGKSVDKRTDIWAFGCVFYEMLTGRRAFEGEDLSLTLAEIVKSEPKWELLPANTPAVVRRSLEACLQKDPRKRLRDLGDLPQLERAVSSVAPSAAPPRAGWLASGVVAGAAVGALLAWWLVSGRVPAPQLVRFAIEVPNGVTLGAYTTPALALSDDGQTLVFVGNEGGVARLYRRTMADVDVSPIPGTENAAFPFLSPDGRNVAFFSLGGRLSRVPLAGGPAQPITSGLGSGLGGTWLADDTIVVASISGGLQRVSAHGGDPQPVPGTSIAYRWPDALPDGEWVLAESTNPDDGTFQIVAISLETGETEVLVSGAHPRYVETGHLVYVRDDAIWAAPFDADARRLLGPGMPIQAGVSVTQGGFQVAPFAVARSGSLVFASGTEQTEVVWMSADDSPVRALKEAGPFVDPRLSPSGRRLALSRADSNQDVWWFDLDDDTSDRVSVQSGGDMAPIWNASGEYLTYAEGSADATGIGIVQVPIDGATGAREELVHGSGAVFPSSWSPDGRFLVYVRIGANDTDIWLYRRDGADGPFLATSANERDPEISPDGHRIAYTSDHSGRPQVYVASFPDGEGARPVSIDGGFQPVWSRSGERLFYRTQTHVMAVDVDEGGFGPPRPLFEAPVIGGLMRSYDVAPDGRFLVLRLWPGSRSRFQVVLNWGEELRRLAVVD